MSRVFRDLPTSNADMWPDGHDGDVPQIPLAEATSAHYRERLRIRSTSTAFPAR